MRAYLLLNDITQGKYNDILSLSPHPNPSPEGDKDLEGEEKDLKTFEILSII